MGEHHNHNNHRHSSSNHNNSHSNRYSHNRQNNPPPQHQHQNPNPHGHQSPRPVKPMTYQYERPVGPTKPSKFSQMKDKFQNKFTKPVPTREQIEQLKMKAEHARYDADVKVHNARKAKAERENPSGWRRLFGATQAQPQKQRPGRVGTRRPTTSRYYGGQGRGPPQMGDSMLIGPGSFSGNNLMFDSSGGQVGDNMFQGNGHMVENDMLSFKGNSMVFAGSKSVKGKKSESMGMGFGNGAMDMFKFG